MLVKIVKPISLIFVVFMLTYGIYANMYAYRIMATVLIIIPAALLLPWLGFGLGYLVAFAFRQPKPRCVAVCVETGYQNPSIPIITLTGSFPQPEGDLGAVLPLICGLFTPVTLCIAYVGILIRNCVRKQRGEGDGEDEEVEELGDGVSKKILVTMKSRQDSKI